MHLRLRLLLLLGLFLCGGCSKEKSTDELIADLSSAQDRDRIIAVRLLPQRKGDASQLIRTSKVVLFKMRPIVH